LAANDVITLSMRPAAAINIGFPEMGSQVLSRGPSPRDDGRVKKSVTARITWFFTVFSLMNIRLPISRLFRPVRDKLEHLELSRPHPWSRYLLPIGAGQLLELIKQLDRHRRGR
jgi:hypothetical protein